MKGEIIVQHFASNEQIIEILSECCEGKVWIEVVWDFWAGKG